MKRTTEKTNTYAYYDPLQDKIITLKHKATGKNSIGEFKVLILNIVKSFLAFLLTSL